MSASAPFVVPTLRLDALRQRLHDRPGTMPAVVIFAAWVALAFQSARDIASGSMDDRRLSLGYWTLMTVAMMGPAALAGIRHTAVNSLSWRRGRAMFEFAAGYVFMWTAFGVALLGIAAVTGMRAGWGFLALVLLAAALWQLTPLKLRWLRDCHRTIALPPTGWAADRAAVEFGARNGLSCVGSCWCLMLVMTAAPSLHIFWTAALALMITVERMANRPLLAIRRHSAALVAAAVVAGFVAARV